MALFKIIVADVDGVSREAVIKALARAGHAVRSASDGHTVLALHEEKAADLIIMDLMVLEADGTPSIRALRQKDGNVPILATTLGGSRDISLQRAKALGAQGLLEKPFRVQEMVAAINGLLPPFPPGADLV